MKELTVYADELDQVGLLNTLAVVFFSAASGCFLFVLGVGTDALMQETLSDKAVGLLLFAIPAGIVLGLGFLGGGVWASVNKKSKIDDMKAQAIEIDQPFPPSIPSERQTSSPSTLDTEDSQSGEAE